MPGEFFPDIIRRMLVRNFKRCAFVLTALASLAVAAPSSAQSGAELSLYGGAAGGAFLPYAKGMADFLNRVPGVRARAVESGGSIANLSVVQRDANAIGLAFLPTVREAVTSTGFAHGRSYGNVRALLPAFRSTYQIAVRGDSDIGRVLDLDRKRVGVGPVGGTDELLFAVAAKDLFIKPQFVNGSIADLGTALLAGEIDALWVGARNPIPAIADVTQKGNVRVLGLSAWDLAGLTERYPYLTPAIVPANTYRGQSRSFATVASWNLLVVHKDLPEDTALAIVKAILEAPDPANDIHPFAIETRAEFLNENRVVDYHPGLMRYLRERPAKAR